MGNYLEETTAFLDALEGRREHAKTFADEKKKVSTIYQLDANRGDAR